MKKQQTAHIPNMVTATKAKASFSAVLAQAGYQGQRIIVKKGRRPTAVILGYEDFQRLADLEDRYESALLTNQFSEAGFDTVDDLGHTDARRLRQVFLKILSLRRSPPPPDSERLSHFTCRGFTGFRVTQGENRIGYAIGFSTVPPSERHLDLINARMVASLRIEPTEKTTA
jgi:prevent-host-death family protein